jgi:hypothetical protein
VENQEQVSHFPTAFSGELNEEKTKAADCVGEGKGDASIEVRKGTFLTRLDTPPKAGLTFTISVTYCAGYVLVVELNAAPVLKAASAKLTMEVESTLKAGFSPSMSAMMEPPLPGW